jgi:hypothetical protein
MEKIYCKHCNQIIGFIYKKQSYVNNNIISPNKYGSISKCKIRGDINYENYGDFNSEIGYTLETQLTCKKCNKKTTIRTKNSY